MAVVVTITEFSDLAYTRDGKAEWPQWNQNVVEQVAITTNAGSQQSSAFGPNTRFVVLSVKSHGGLGTDTAQYSIGDNPTADANSPCIPHDGYLTIGVKAGDKVAIFGP
ncbi:MAG: hypothetical protein VW518_04340 [Burkholderiaceae bacterium]